MDNTSITKLKKVLIANIVCLFLMVSALLMSPQNNLALALTSQNNNPNNDQSASQPQYNSATGPLYIGLIHNASVDATADMTLSFTSVTQRGIQGYFKITNGSLVGSGPFTGTVNNQSIVFTSSADDGSNDTIKFNGSIHTIDGSISGSYSASSPTILRQVGIWYVVPQVSYPPNAWNM